MASAAGRLFNMEARRLVMLGLRKYSDIATKNLPKITRTINDKLVSFVGRHTARHPIHPRAVLKQSKRRWFSNLGSSGASRSYQTSTRASYAERARFAKTKVGSAVNRFTHQAPFATTLRPNLTGGALPRTAGGYGFGSGQIGGARYFSHMPASPVQVVSNVSSAVRAFWLSGQRAHFDGVNPQNGEKKFTAVSSLQQETTRKLSSFGSIVPGSYINFHFSPTITALGSFSGLRNFDSSDNVTLNQDSFLDLLSGDFARAIKDFAAIINDLKKLAVLGDLPIELSRQSTVTVRFPGCDADTVERLCIELGIKRGIVYQDENFDEAVGTEMALLFPFAPSEIASQRSGIPSAVSPEALYWADMLSPESRSPGFSHRSQISMEQGFEQEVSSGFEEIASMQENPWIISPSDYSSGEDAHEASNTNDALYETPFLEDTRETTSMKSLADCEGVEAIHKFLEECDRARR